MEKCHSTPADREIVHGYGSEYTWGDFGKKVVSIIASRHSSGTKIVCVNYVCNLKYTIKMMNGIGNQRT